MSRKVMLLAGLACVAIAAGWYLFAWSPGQSAMKAANERKAAAVKQQADLTVQLANLKAAAKTLPDMKAKIAALRAAIPSSPELDKVLATVNDAANGAGVELTTLSPAPPATLAKNSAASSAPSTASPQPSPGLPSMGVTISAKGSYFQVVDFVNRLNGAPRLVVVDNISLSGQGGNKDQNAIVQAQLVGRMFMSGGK